jgi:hypothetical protein
MMPTRSCPDRLSEPESSVTWLILAPDVARGKGATEGLVIDAVSREDQH